MLAATVCLIDQLSKWYITETVIKPKIESLITPTLGFFEWLNDAPARLPFTSIEVFPYFNIVMVWNTGVSFGMFSQNSELGPMILSGLSLFIIVFFTVWLFRSNSNADRFAIALIIGGALGNILDRLRFGAVIDFLDFHAFGWHYPAFNVSDSCVVIGVFLLIIRSFFFENQTKDAK